MESFYGGRQGASIVITKQFDVINSITSNTSNTEKYKIYYCLTKKIGGEYIYITQSDAQDDKLIIRNKDNWNSYPGYKWEPTLAEKNVELNYTPYRQDGDYSGVTPSPKVFFSENESAESMLDCFKLGNNSTDIVNYGEYVIINSPIINHPDNGKIFRRGLDHDNDMYGAEYIGQIVGPQGESPEIDIKGYSDITIPQEGFNGKSGNIEMKSGKTLDVIQYKYVTVKDKFGNVVGCDIGFQFPQFELEVKGQSISPYENRVEQTANPEGNYNYKDLAEPDSSVYNSTLDKWTHPFYQRWNIKIPKGIHGKDVENIDIVYTKAKKDAPYYSSLLQATPTGYLSNEVDIACDTLNNEYEGNHDDIYQLYGDQKNKCKIVLNENEYYVPIEFCYKSYLRYKKKSYNESAIGTITYHKICDCNLKPDASDTNITYYNSENQLTSSDLQSYLNELKNSVSDGKASLASAITEKGVSTLASDSFQTMAGNIGRIFDANPGSISSSVNVSVPDTLTSTVNISAPMSISTAGYHSNSKGTRTQGNATAYLTRNGNKIYLSSTSDRSSGNKDYGIYTVPTLWDMFYSGSLAVNNSTTQEWKDKDGNNHSGEKYVYMKYDKTGYINDTNWWIGRPASDFGNAAKSEVISGKTFTSAAGLKVTGTYTVPTETETITAGTSNKTVTPTSGKYFSSVTVRPTPTEAVSITAGIDDETETPSSGKYFSSVTVRPTPSHIKIVESPTTDNIEVTPDSGYLLSSVTVTAPHQLRNSFYAAELGLNSSVGNYLYDNLGNVISNGDYVYMYYGTPGYTLSNNRIGRPIEDFGDAEALDVVSGATCTAYGIGLKGAGLLGNGSGITFLSGWVTTLSSSSLYSEMSSSYVGHHLLVVVLTNRNNGTLVDVIFIPKKLFGGGTWKSGAESKAKALVNNDKYLNISGLTPTSYSVNVYCYGY